MMNDDDDDYDEGDDDVMTESESSRPARPHRSPPDLVDQTRSQNLLPRGSGGRSRSLRCCSHDGVVCARGPKVKWRTHTGVAAARQRLQLDFRHIVVLINDVRGFNEAVLPGKIAVATRQNVRAVKETDSNASCFCSNRNHQLGFARGSSNLSSVVFFLFLYLFFSSPILLIHLSCLYLLLCFLSPSPSFVACSYF